ncbi:indole-3-acetic acid-induced protein arg7 [Phtheirospermum japonicum]|uniref:Indole-3-acetic acid-induced protein arg7 n=1 Tax=Phtheirospermum japonicum TaxID=374723 RepID=A0A830BMW4_9LAMI|nr:indole-3-acetic acid-induced protein arg7 [Phtheirospermum japonicum]
MFRKLERCLSITKKANEKGIVTPTGCFSVYVGPQKQRFVIKTEFVNHPLFKILLEDAELEYGFTNKGPLLIPCEVDLFCKVLTEMDCDDGKYFDDHNSQPCGFSYGSCSPFNPGRGLGICGLTQGCGSYKLQTPPQFLEIKHF